MTELHLDEQWNLIKVITEGDLSTWANSFQEKYFPGPIPNIRIAINRNPSFGGAASFDPNGMLITIAKPLTQFESISKIALLHEMIHVKLYLENGNNDADDNHGPRFQTEVKRLQNEGAYDGLL